MTLKTTRRIAALCAATALFGPAAHAQWDDSSKRSTITSTYVPPIAKPAEPMPGPSSGPIPWSQIGVDLNGQQLFLGSGWRAGTAGPARFTGLLTSFSPSGYRLHGLTSVVCAPDCTVVRQNAENASTVVPWDNSFLSQMQMSGCNDNGGWAFCSSWGLSLGSPSGHWREYTDQGPVSGHFIRTMDEGPAIYYRTDSSGLNTPVLSLGLYTADGAKYSHRVTNKLQAEFVAGVGRTQFTKTGGSATFNKYAGFHTVAVYEVGSFDLCWDGSMPTPQGGRGFYGGICPTPPEPPADGGGS